jgi:hypothetical protein
MQQTVTFGFSVVGFSTIGDHRGCINEPDADD